MDTVMEFGHPSSFKGDDILAFARPELSVLELNVADPKFWHFFDQIEREEKSHWDKRHLGVFKNAYNIDSGMEWPVRRATDPNSDAYQIHAAPGDTLLDKIQRHQTKQRLVESLLLREKLLQKVRPLIETLDQFYLDTRRSTNENLRQKIVNEATERFDIDADHGVTQEDISKSLETLSKRRLNSHPDCDTDIHSKLMDVWNETKNSVYPMLIGVSALNIPFCIYEPPDDSWFYKPIDSVSFEERFWCIAEAAEEVIPMLQEELSDFDGYDQKYREKGIFAGEQNIQMYHQLKSRVEDRFAEEIQTRVDIPISTQDPEEIHHSCDFDLLQGPVSDDTEQSSVRNYLIENSKSHIDFRVKNLHRFFWGIIHHTESDGKVLTMPPFVEDDSLWDKWVGTFTIHSLLKQIVRRSIDRKPVEFQCPMCHYSVESESCGRDRIHTMTENADQLASVLKPVEVEQESELLEYRAGRVN